MEILNRHLWFFLRFQIEILEKHLEQQLVERIPGFNMDSFTHSLKYGEFTSCSKPEYNII